MTPPEQPVPDFLRPGLKLVIVGINPGIRSGASGHHYAWPGNHFWPALYEARIIPVPLTYADDGRVLEWDIGLTNLVHRPSRQASDLTRQELASGAAELREKLRRFRPLVACFNGKGIYEAFSGRRSPAVGLQPETLEGIRLFVVPSSSARTAAYQRAAKIALWRELGELVATLASEAAAAPR